MAALKFLKVNQNRVNQLCSDLVDVRNKINETLSTPKKVLPELNKHFRLDGLDNEEDFILLQLAVKKGIIKFSSN